MDTTAMNIWKESMRKEQKFARKWAEENRERMGEEDAEFLATLRSSNSPNKMKSSAEHFLDQSLAVSSNPYDKSRPPSPDMLYFGVSGEGKGRTAYLKRRTEKGPQEKFGRPVTTSQLVGWSTPVIQTGSSPFARRPLIKSTFYRSCGVMRGE
jgi:hypothetical protein